MQAAGQYNRRVTIQSRASGQDAYGQPNGAWQTLVSGWAKYMTPGGANAAAERVSADREASSVVCIFRLRGYRTDITSGMRLTHGLVVYDIKQVSPDEAKREFVDLACVTGLSEG